MSSSAPRCPVGTNCLAHPAPHWSRGALFQRVFPTRWRTKNPWMCPRARLDEVGAALALREQRRDRRPAQTYQRGQDRQNRRGRQGFARDHGALPQAKSRHCGNADILES